MYGPRPPMWRARLYSIEDIEAMKNSAEKTVRELPALYSRYDTPKSGSRREAINILYNAARCCEALAMRGDYDGPSGTSVLAAINYMIMHDGW